MAIIDVNLLVTFHKLNEGILFVHLANVTRFEINV